MKIAYNAANVADAYLFRQRLEAEDIPAFVIGEYGRGGVGELPANTGVLVWVADDDLEAARALVAEWEGDLPALADDEAGEVDEDRVEANVADVRQSSGYIIARRGILLVAVVLGGALLLSWLRTLAGRGG